MSVEKTGGRYVRDPKTGVTEQVDGPALRAAQAVQAAKPGAKTKAAPPATPPAGGDEKE